MGELLSALGQFKGTEQEVRVTDELLLQFKQQNCPSRWLDVYLALIYTHPADPAVRRHLREAVGIGQEIGREQDMADAIELLNRVQAYVASKSTRFGT